MTTALRRMTLALGILSIVALGVSALALTDIAHGEPDLRLEWNVLRACAAIVVLFHAMAMRVLLRR